MAPRAGGTRFSRSFYDGAPVEHPHRSCRGGAGWGRPNAVPDPFDPLADDSHRR